MIRQGKPCSRGHGTARYSDGGCVECSKENSKVRHRAGGKKSRYNPLDRRARNLRAKYGITTEQYDTMLADQCFGCAICGGDAGGSAKRFHVDHCHKTGAIRGLLCYKCNIGLGSFEDDPSKMRLAIQYLSCRR